jgi:hypothetical protein
MTMVTRHLKARKPKKITRLGALKGYSRARHKNPQVPAAEELIEIVGNILGGFCLANFTSRTSG